MKNDFSCSCLAGGPKFTGPWLGTSWFGFHQNGGPDVVNIKGEIGIGSDVEDLLAALAGAKEIELIINSAGGSTTTAFKLLDGLAGRVIKATIYNQCYSAAIIVACSAKKIMIDAGARMMIHPASDFVFGQESDLRRRADCLAKINARQKELLARRTPRAAEFLSGPDCWFTASEALTAGLVDEIFTHPMEPADNPSRTGETSLVKEIGPTDDERLFHEFLRAFGPIKTHSRQQFARAVTAWAVHNSVEA